MMGTGTFDLHIPPHPNKQHERNFDSAILTSLDQHKLLSFRLQSEFCVWRMFESVYIQHVGDWNMVYGKRTYPLFPRW